MDTTNSSPPNINISPSEATFLKDLLEGEVQRCRAVVELHNLTEAAHKNEGTNRQPLVERLNEYPANGVDLQNLVSYPPKLEPVPVKPLFFDAAWNYIQYPGREVEKVSVDAAKGGEKVDGKYQTVQQKKGWFGFGR